MRFEDLVEVMADTKTLPRLTPDQLEFRFNPVKKQVAGSFAFAGTRLLRMQTQQSWECTVEVTLDDRTTGRTRHLPFQITVRGTIPRDKAKAAAALKWLLPCYLEGDGVSRFDGAKMIKDVLRGVLHQHDADINGAHARAASAREIDKTQTKLCLAICDAGLIVSEVELYPRNLNPAINGRIDELVTFKDEGNPLKIRDRKLLGELAVGYLARLRFASGEPAVVANYAYAGSVYGRQAGVALADPGSPGQIQPLEAWFRQILERELLRENLDATKPVASDALKARISAILIQGTGREIDGDLILLPARNAKDAQAAIGSLSFAGAYGLHYAGKAPIKIVHELLYEVNDQDRWRSAGSPDVKELLEKLVRSAVQSFLHGKSYAEIVELYAESDQEKGPLDDEVQRSVIEEAMTYGITVRGPIASIHEIPGSSFIGKRHQVVLEEAAYQMRESDVRTCCTITADLTLSREPAEQQRFVKAFQESDDFSQMVRREVKAIVKEALETRIRPAQFYNAILVVQSIETDIEPDDVVESLKEALQNKLIERFGLTVEKLLIQRADQDQVAKRLFELRRDNRVSGIATTSRGSNLKTFYHLPFTVLIRNIMIDKWHRFHAHVGMPSLQDHLHEVEKTAKEALESLVSSFSGEDDQLRLAIDNGAVAWQLANRIAAECGLAVEVIKLELEIETPHADEGMQTKLEIRENKLTRLRAQYDDGGAFGSHHDADLEQIDRLIDEIETIKTQIRQTAQAQGKLTTRLVAPVGLLANGRPDQQARKLLGTSVDAGSEGAA
ncbi:MAG: hypothetical protein WCL10_19130 [Novosphingobium sp.]|jgi:hypothetical protein|uniref:hypothetical protein n=1 Tax=Novosphingobium sp. TaxID=1874826 RepID=UPI00301A9E0F